MSNSTFISPSNKIAVASFLQTCTNVDNLLQGRIIHAEIAGCGLEQDQYLGNVIVQMYGNCGAMADATAVFSRMQESNIFSWKILIGTYLRFEREKDTLQLFQLLQLQSMLPDKITYLLALSACNNVGMLLRGKRLHACVIGDLNYIDVVLGTAILSMYSRCGSIENSQRIFKHMLERNTVCWNAMIATYVQHELTGDACSVFKRMLEEGQLPDEATIRPLTTISSASLTTMSLCKQVHVLALGCQLDSDTGIANALISMYGKNGCLKEAYLMFDSIPHKDVVSWSAMIAACAQAGLLETASQFFSQMHHECIIPNQVTYTSIFPLFATETCLNESKLMHARIIGCNFDSNVNVQTALLSMYNKLGCLIDARQVFDEMPERNRITWNAMMAAYGQHGKYNKLLLMFSQMQAEGVTPNDVTFVSVLSACSHIGAVEDGFRYFISMVHDFHIEPDSKHYDCLIALLSRAGLLDEVEKLMEIMPCEPSSSSWLTLLGACRTLMDKRRGQTAAEHVICLDPESTIPYILLSNIYAAGTE